MFKPVYSKDVARCLGLDKIARRKRILVLSLVLSCSIFLAVKMESIAQANERILSEGAARISPGQPPQGTAKAPAVAARPARDANVVAVADFVSKRYRIASDAAIHIVEATFSAAKKAKNVDPITVVAIMAVESSFNPIAESEAGAKGLTQSLPRAHPEKMLDLRRKNGHILDISDNIAVGVRIYSEYLVKYAGDETRALQQYNGSLHDRKREYSKKVLLVKGRIRSHMESTHREG